MQCYFPCKTFCTPTSALSQLRVQCPMWLFSIVPLFRAFPVCCSGIFWMILIWFQSPHFYWFHFRCHIIIIIIVSRCLFLKFTKFTACILNEIMIWCVPLRAGMCGCNSGRVICVNLPTNGNCRNFRLNFQRLPHWRCKTIIWNIMLSNIYIYILV